MWWEICLLESVCHIGVGTVQCTWYSLEEALKLLKILTNKFGVCVIPFDARAEILENYLVWIEKIAYLICALLDSISWKSASSSPQCERVVRLNSSTVISQKSNDRDTLKSLYSCRLKYYVLNRRMKSFQIFYIELYSRVNWKISRFSVFNNNNFETISNFHSKDTHISKWIPNWSRKCKTFSDSVCGHQFKHSIS